MWFLRVITALVLLCGLLMVSVPIGLYTMPELDLWLALGLAVVTGVVLIITIKLMLFAVLGSFILATILILAVTLLSQLVFFETEKRAWIDQTEVAYRSDPSQKNTQQNTQQNNDQSYLESLEIEPNPNPVINWLNHTQQQAQTSLSSQQLKPNEVGTPKAQLTPSEVWLGWLYQLMMFVCSLFCAAWIAPRK